MFLRMDRPSSNGYAVVLDFSPTEADLDAIFEHYVIRGQKEKFERSGEGTTGFEPATFGLGSPPRRRERIHRLPPAKPVCAAYAPEPAGDA